MMHSWYKKGVLFIGFPLLFSATSQAQTGVDFPSEDGLMIHADLYKAGDSMKYILLFHQAGSSRGEYREIAPRLVQMGFNCLAVDLRSGGERNYVRNITADLAKSKRLSTGSLDAITDIRSAIHYAVQKSGKPVIILGSSYSASLCLAESAMNPYVQAAIAFSPGEYFGNRFSLTDSLKYLNKPVFVYATSAEYPYVARMFEQSSNKGFTLVQPMNEAGHHGSASLLKENSESHEIWLALMIFLRNITFSNR